MMKLFMFCFLAAIASPAFGQSCNECHGLESRIERLEKKVTVLETMINWYHVRGTNHWYILRKDKSTYAQAMQRCEALGGRLAASGMRDSYIRNIVLTELVKPNNENVWVGLDDLVLKYRWVWADGTVSTRGNTDWARNEPNNPDERCCVLYDKLNFQINDSTCNSRYSYLCEKVA